MRSSTVEVDAYLRELLGAHLVEDAGAPPNYSLSLHPDGRGGGPARPMHTVYRDGATLITNRSARRALSALLADLDMLAERSLRSAELVSVLGLAVVDGERAVLVPRSVVLALPRIERELARAGLRVVDQPLPRLDAATGELVVGPQFLRVEEGMLDEIDELAPPARRELPAGRPGRYSVVGWVFPEESAPLPLSPAAGVLHATSLVRNVSAVHPERVLDCLAAVLSSAATATRSTWDRSAVPLLRALADG